MASSFAIQHIIKNNPIVPYLISKGYHPRSESNGRYKFNCPLHKEDDPSFVVYSEDDNSQNFYCFGCKQGGSIITLKKLLENKSNKEVIQSLLKGSEININDEFEYILSILKDSKEFSSEYDIEDLLFLISRTVYYFFQEIDYQEPYFSRFEKVLQLADDAFFKLDIEGLEEIYNSLQDIIERQRKEYQENIEKEKEEVRKAYG